MPMGITRVLLVIALMMVLGGFGRPAIAQQDRPVFDDEIHVVTWDDLQYPTLLAWSNVSMANSQIRERSVPLPQLLAGSNCA
jgi:hypothetical protein